MQLDELNDALLRHLWLPAAANAPADAKADVKDAVNAAFQEIWSAPADFYRKSESTFATVAATATYALPSGLQQVLSPVRIGTAYLRLLTSRSDGDHYGARFLGTTDPITAGQPTAYFIERLRASTGPDLAEVTMRLYPTPDDVYTVTYNRVMECPSYTLAQLLTTASVDFPHQYVESILLPVAKKKLLATKFFLHYQPEQTNQKAALTEQEYTAARQILGFVDPQQPEGNSNPPSK